MLSVKILSPLYIRDNIEHILSELSRADDNTLSIEDIKEDLILGDYDLYAAFLEEGIKYYLLASVIGKSYFIMRVAGSGKLFPWEDFFEVMYPIAKSKDCVEISFSGSKDWESKVKDLGFRIKEYTYTLEV